MEQAVKVPQTESTAPRASQSFLNTALKSIWRVYTANTKVTVGLSIILVFVLLGVFGPMIARHDPLQLYVGEKNLAPSAEFWLGTTDLGQDIFSQLMTGTRNSIFWSLITAFLVTLVSISVGLVGGYIGGVIDEILSFITNIFLVIPGLPLAIVMAAYFPAGPLSVALIVLVTNWAWGARVLRAQTMSMRNREFVTASRSSGEKMWRIIFIEILPNEMGLVAANFVSTTVWVVLTWAALDFLGLGDPNSVSWGYILFKAQNTNALLLGYWYWFVPPGLCIAILGAALTLINFGIDEIADPRLRIHRLPKDLKKKVIA